MNMDNTKLQDLCDRLEALAAVEKCGLKTIQTRINLTRTLLDAEIIQRGFGHECFPAKTQKNQHKNRHDTWNLALARLHRLLVA